MGSGDFDWVLRAGQDDSPSDTDACRFFHPEPQPPRVHGDFARASLHAPCQRGVARETSVF